TEMMTQLILTIGKARTFDTILPPPYIGCFDNVKIAFVPYYEIQEIFYMNDFNWNVTSSNSGTKEFRLIYDKLEQMIGNKLFIFNFEKDETELHSFIKENFVVGKTGTAKIQINKNNFIGIYNKWLTEVKPTIQLNFTWDEAKNQGYLDADFYLADLMSEDNKTLGDKLYVLLKETYYKFDKEIKIDGRITYSEVHFTDNQKAHNLFWARYERPPREEYREFILERRDLLVPQDIRERKGSFFTPQIWVELSQKYIADVFGENWQEEYYIWDCACGTGNMLVGLTEKYRVYGSTLDKADVNVIHERIENGANLLKEHIFQFDFLNDEFDKLPSKLLKIIKETPEKLIIYINPPYAETGTTLFRESKVGVNLSQTHSKYKSLLGTAGRELFIQFLTRIYQEIKGCKIAEFSTLKALQGSAFNQFRDFFHTRLEKMFIAPANTFDNVKGNFPIGFKIWDSSKKEGFKEIQSDVYDSKGNYIGEKTYRAYDKSQYINKWITSFKTGNDYIGFMAGTNRNDFQNNKMVYLINHKNQMPEPRGVWISKDNLIPVVIYLSARHIISATWLNDRDQFLYPDDDWKIDKEFHSNCLIYSLFSNSNTISSKHGINNWIPFTEKEVTAKDSFDSHFMTDFMTGKVKSELKQITIFENDSKPTENSPLQFSEQAQVVFSAGKELWKYYHFQPKCNVNASFYDIREHFQGRDDKGRMNSSSDDEKYNDLIRKLRMELKELARQIEPKIYEYGFLKI
ncbi:MAG: hypothetical protein FWG20_06740, partial [Candidatus Cloacimonetes bacterium]|nr:hypothetical protein [Candidatus Cloacimonadota bacterium]